jgi:hypothetical protein
LKYDLQAVEDLSLRLASSWKALEDLFLEELRRVVLYGGKGWTVERRTRQFAKLTCDSEAVEYSFLEPSWVMANVRKGRTNFGLVGEQKFSRREGSSQAWQWQARPNLNTLKKAMTSLSESS